MYRVRNILKCGELCAGWWTLVLWGSSVCRRPVESVGLVGAPPLVQPERWHLLLLKMRVVQSRHITKDGLLVLKAYQMISILALAALH